MMSDSHTVVVQLLQDLLQRGKEGTSAERDGGSGSSGECQAVIAECGRCLGELGAVDLKQVALPELNQSGNCTREGSCLPNTVHM